MRNKILWYDETKIALQASRLEETWHHPYGEGWWWQHHAVGMFFQWQGWETSQDPGKDERSKGQRDPWQKPAPECLGPQTRVKVHLPTGQWHYAYSQDNAGVALGQVSEYLWVAQPEPGQTFLDRPENSCAATLPIQRNSAWEERNGRNSKYCAKLVALYWL